MKKTIGDILVASNVLSESEATKIAAHGRAFGMLFGEAGVALGLLNKDLPLDAACVENKHPYFKLTPGFLPQNTKGLLPKEVMMKQGVIPLGIKSKKTLNLGVIAGLNLSELEEVKAQCLSLLAEKGISKVQFYAIAADEFVSMAKQHFGVEAITEAPEALHPTLRSFVLIKQAAPRQRRANDQKITQNPSNSTDKE